MAPRRGQRTRPSEEIWELPEIGKVTIRRSARRRKTVSAFYEAGRLVVALPVNLSHSQEDHWVRTLTQRLRTRSVAPSDADLAERSEFLAAQYLPDGVRPSSIRWVTNQNHRWGSASLDTRQIRLSHRLLGMPQWVIDYVIVHELAHLVVAGHSADFWSIVDQYPHTQKARGFLEGFSHAANHPDPATHPPEA